MTPEQVNREMIEFRRELAALLERFAGGERTALYPATRELADALTSLLEEGPVAKQPVVSTLLDRCETFMRHLRN